MNYNDFSLDKIDEIPIAPRGQEDIREYDAVIIVPMNKMHDSGFMCMSYLFCDGEEIVCRSNGFSDVLDIDGIGGYGDWYPGEIPAVIEPRGWVIDCLPNGYLRLFCRNGKIKNGNGLSDYEIFAKIKRRKDTK